MKIPNQVQSGLLRTVDFAQLPTEGENLIEEAGLTPRGEYSLTGTSTASGTAVAGTGTAYTTEINVGDLIHITNVPKEYRKVVSITDDENLVVDSAFTFPFTNAVCSGQDTTQYKQAVNILAQAKLPKGYINGGVASNNATTPDSIVDITALEARSDDNTTDISLPAQDLDLTLAGDHKSGVAPVIELQPLMTSNTTGQRTPAGIVTAIGEANPAYLALDGIKTGTTSYWAYNATSGWWNYNFETTVRLKGLRFYNRYSNESNRCKDVEVYRNGSIGDVIATFTGVNANYGLSTVMFNDTIELSQIGFNVLNSYNVQIGFMEVEFIFEDLSNSTFHMWADKDANRFYFDDATGSNITGAKVNSDIITTDSNGVIRDIVELGEKYEIEHDFIQEVEILNITNSNQTNQDLQTPINFGKPTKVFVRIEIGDNGASGTPTGTLTVNSYNSSKKCIVSNRLDSQQNHNSFELITDSGGKLKYTTSGMNSSSTAKAFLMGYVVRR